jgi:subfamily B ATP-binding cassette protein MsbA
MKGLHGGAPSGLAGCGAPVAWRLSTPGFLALYCALRIDIFSDPDPLEDPLASAPSTDLGPQLRRIFRLARPHAARIGLCLLLILLATAVQLSLPLGVQMLFDQMLVEEEPQWIHWVAAGLLALFVLRSVLSFVGSFLLQVAGDRIIVELREQLFQHLHSLSLGGYHDHQRVGDLLSRLSNDVAAIRNVVSNTLVSLIVNVFQLVGAAAVMMAMNWRLGLIVLAVGPLTTLVSKLFGPVFQRLSGRIQDELAHSTTVAQESLAAIQVTKAFAREEHEARRYGQTMARFLQAAIEARKVDASFNALVAFLGSSSTIAIFWFGGMEVIDDRLTAGALVAFLLYSQNITQSIGALAQHYSSLSQTVGASRRVFEILDIEPDIRDRPGAVDVAPGPATVAFEDVGFRYRPDRQVLDGVSLAAGPGETIALVGPSGAGKSTLVKLLPRFYDVTSGRILLNGRDVRDYKLRSLREAVAIVSQDVFLFGTTVRENIRYGRLDATDSEVEAAARAANAEEFIVELAEGYDTEVGERGVRLSGGQRQRISIARALLKDAPILVLDEATSAVDTASEAAIQEAVERLKAQRTTFVIAHRQATVRHADQIVVLRDGQVAERGTFDQLVARGGIYRELILEREPAPVETA